MTVSSWKYDDALLALLGRRGKVSADKLKSCPFCGGRAEEFHSIVDVYICICEHCRAQTGGTWTANAAKERWNRRAKEKGRER